MAQLAACRPPVTATAAKRSAACDQRGRFRAAPAAEIATTATVDDTIAIQRPALLPRLPRPA